MVLKKLKKVNLMLKLKKCNWCEPNIAFLGHMVRRDGLKPDPTKIEKVKNIKEPTNLKGVRSFLGLCSYYRRFVKGFSKIAKPLNDLKKKDRVFEWKIEQQEFFDKLKEMLVSHPILEYPDWNKEFILITDASGEGLGVVLSQINDNGKEVVIAYASRSLRGVEVNYPITEMECLAIVWGIEHFHKYLIANKFTVITDHSALKTLKTVKCPKKGRRARWIMELQQYDFEIKHRPGKQNNNADALSRLKYKKDEESDEKLF